jgi:hypothetical protein
MACNNGPISKRKMAWTVRRWRSSNLFEGAISPSSGFELPNGLGLLLPIYNENETEEVVAHVETCDSCAPLCPRRWPVGDSLGGQPTFNGMR